MSSSGRDPAPSSISREHPLTIRATTAPGIEDIAREEGGRLLAEAGYNVVLDPPGDFVLPAGVVRWSLAPAPAVSEIIARDPLRGVRSLFHVVVHVAELVWDGRTLVSLLDGIRSVDLARMRGGGAYRVSCSRVGDHDFQSPEVEREVGAVVQERFGNPVDLERYEIHVKIDVVGTRAFVGYQITRRKGLDRRYPWVYHPRVTLRTPIAFAMLVLSGYVDRPGPLHDPFCGSGTILLEAAGVCDDSGVPHPPLGASDRDPAAVSGAAANFAAAGVASVTVSLHDARSLHELLPARPLDYIVTNPPFGVRLAKGINFQSLYRSFLEASSQVLRPGGVLALLVGKHRGVFNRVLREWPTFALEHVRVIEMGGVYPALFVLRRTTVDERTSFTP